MKKKQKCYIYTRVSTAVQVDDYMLTRYESQSALFFCLKLSFYAYL